MLTVILIAALFYIPFHVGPPVLLALLYGQDAGQRMEYARAVLLESVTTMFVSLGAFFWLWQDHLLAAVLIMIVMMAVPYWRVWRYRKTTLQNS